MHRATPASWRRRSWNPTSSCRADVCCTRQCRPSRRTAGEGRRRPSRLAHWLDQPERVKNSAAESAAVWRTRSPRSSAPGDIRRPSPAKWPRTTQLLSALQAAGKPIRSPHGRAHRAGATQPRKPLAEVTAVGRRRRGAREVAARSQLTAFFTRARILASSAAVKSLSA
jgi:hypothetical protein